MLSECRRYRYALWRVWEPAEPWVLFIGLNPSTADETSDDATIRRCMGFAKAWGYGGMAVANLFGVRSTDPKQLPMIPDPIGPQNDDWLTRLYAGAEITLAAWGAGGKFLDRGEAVAAKLGSLHCLGRTMCGQPRHPLYMPARSKPEKFC